MLKRLKGEAGFGLIELSMAMVMLNVGILAIVAAFNSGAVALRRASIVANATALADTAMEGYRGKRNCQIYLTASTMPVSTTTYATDTGAFSAAGSYFSSSTVAASQTWVTDTGDATYQTNWSGAHSPVVSPSATGCTGTGTTAHNSSAVGADNRTYILDTYIYLLQVNSQGWQKQVTIVVRDPRNPTGSLVRESSTFDPFDQP